MPDAPQRLAAALADRYRLEGKLGSGAMATVYLARDLRHDRQAAIEVRCLHALADFPAVRLVHGCRVDGIMR